MNINVQAINDCLEIDGPIWIESDLSNCETILKHYVFNSEWQRQLARENAIKRNSNYKGENNPRAKTWKIVYDDGREIIIKALQRWAVDNGYSTSGIKNIAYGKWKRYKNLVSVEELAQAPTQKALDAL
jgi:hypothetical protein